MVSLDELRARPIDSTLERELKEYWNDRTHFQRQVISQIEEDEFHPLFHEKLGDCQACGIRTKNYYYKQTELQQQVELRPYLHPQVFLRQSVLHSLIKVDRFLARYRLRLELLSGYRHPLLQRAVISLAEQQGKGRLAKKMLADPDHHLPHATGAAFDLEVWDHKHRKVLPTKVKQACNRSALEGRTDLSAEQEQIRDNRRLIHNLLTLPYVLSEVEVFVPHPFEYWHYGRGEKLSVFFSQQSGPACYGQIT